MSAENEFAALGALAPEQAAQIIYRHLFENGPARLSGANKFIAIGSIYGALQEWRKQILAESEGAASTWKKKYQEAKAELDDVRLKLAILQKER